MYAFRRLINIEINLCRVLIGEMYMQFNYSAEAFYFMYFLSHIYIRICFLIPMK